MVRFLGNPMVLRDVCEQAIVRNMDMDQYEGVLMQEKEDIKVLKEVAAELD